MNGDAPKVLSVFSGAGGLDLGLECAGFETIGCVELDEDARRTLQANRPAWKLLGRNVTTTVRQLMPEKLGLAPGELGVLCGGPPCQPFSKAAQWVDGGRSGIKDSRAKCIRSFFTLAKRFLPRAILIENVPGFLQGKNSAQPLIQKLLVQIEDETGFSYTLTSEKLDAADFGVPQHRQRAILVALRDDNEFEWPEPSHSDLRVRAWDALASFSPLDKERPGGKWADLLPSVPEGENYQYFTEEGEGPSLFGYRTRFWSFLLKLAKDAPAWTLPANPGPATGPFHWENRPLTIHEMLRLQSFPASWKLVGGKRARIRLAGNATPPLLSEVVGRAIGTQVFGIQYATPPLLSIERQSIVPEPDRPAPLPPHYRSRIGKHDRHPGIGKGPKYQKEGVDQGSV